MWLVRAGLLVQEGRGKGSWHWPWGLPCCGERSQQSAELGTRQEPRGPSPPWCRLEGGPCRRTSHGCALCSRPPRGEGCSTRKLGPCGAPRSCFRSGSWCWQQAARSTSTGLGEPGLGATGCAARSPQPSPGAAPSALGSGVSLQPLLRVPLGNPPPGSPAPLGSRAGGSQPREPPADTLAPSVPAPTDAGCVSSGLPRALCPRPLCSVYTSPSSPPAMGTEPAAPTGEPPAPPACHTRALEQEGPRRETEAPEQ